jgi:hypothetical protein
MSEKQLNKWNELTRQAYTKVGDKFRMDPASLVGATLWEQMLQNQKGHLSEFTVEGNVEENEKDPSGKRYLKKIEKAGGRLVHRTISDDSYGASFLFDHGMVNVAYSGEYLRVSCLSTDDKFAVDLQKEISKEILPRVQRGHIFAIVVNDGSLRINSIGYAGIPLTPDNYTKQVMTDYQYAVKDLKTENPSGRIVIMEGEPGTGKTHLIRALLADVPDAMFVLISPDMVPSIAGPELLPLLMQNKQSYALDGPIILVLEDADRCLVRREADNISSIQALLNLGDGIVGSLLDLRIIATTNAKKLEMESAILRPGRLSKRMEVGALDAYTARNVFGRLLPGKPLPELLMSQSDKFKMTLAEVYGLARQNGWEPEARTTKKKKKTYLPSSYYYDD